MDNSSVKEDETHNFETAGHAIRDFVAGMYDEVTTHPGKLAIEAGAGAAIAAGSLFLGPEACAAAAIVGTAAGLYELGNGIVHMADEVKVIDNADHKYTPAQINEAHLAVRHMGAYSMDSLAVMGGGIAGYEATRIGLAFHPNLGLNESPIPFVSGFHFKPGFVAAGDVSVSTDAFHHLWRPLPKT